MRNMTLNVAFVALVSFLALASKLTNSTPETIFCSLFWKSLIGLSVRSLRFFWKQSENFYGFLPLFNILSTENALRLIDHWFNKTEFSDTHYYVAYSHFVFFYLCEMVILADSSALRIEAHIRCYPGVWLAS